jgi:hypothetical protein
VWIETSRHTTPQESRGVAYWEKVVVVLTVLAVVIAVLVLSRVCVYAIDRIRPGWLRIRAGTFSIEMGQGGDPPGDVAPRDERRELEAGRDKARELEAGPAPSWSGQDNSAA